MYGLDPAYAWWVPTPLAGAARPAHIREWVPILVEARRAAWGPRYVCLSPTLPALRVPGPGILRLEDGHAYLVNATVIDPRWLPEYHDPQWDVEAWRGGARAVHPVWGLAMDAWYMPLPPAVEATPVFVDGRPQYRATITVYPPKEVRLYRAALCG